MIHEPDDLSPAARALLGRMRPLDEPDAERLARVRGHVVGAATGTLVVASFLPAVRAWWTAGASKIGLCLALVAAGGVIVHAKRAWQVPALPVVASSASAPNRAGASVSVSPPESEVLPESELVEELPTPAEVPVAAPAKKPVAKPAALPAPLAEEAAILRDAQSALANGHAGRALELFESHAKLFPHGQLVPERIVGHALAGCALDRPEAKTEARAIIAAGALPGLAARLRKRCGLDE